MTSALLARKGEAAPSTVAAQIGSLGIASTKVGFFDRPSEPAVKASPEALPPKPVKKRTKPGMVRGQKRRIVLTVSQDEFERLGIAAVKKDLTRQELLREAVQDYLDETARSHDSCRCIAHSVAGDRK